MEVGFSKIDKGRGVGEGRVLVQKEKVGVEVEVGFPKIGKGWGVGRGRVLVQKKKVEVEVEVQILF